MKTWMRALAALSVSIAAAACGGGDEEPVETAAMRGEKVYKNVCATCHGADPNLEGVLGPDIADASLELLRTRIVDGTYPPGYTPKRNTKQMTALPHLEPVIPELHAYLQSVRR